MIDVRQSVREEVEASIVRQGCPLIPIQESQIRFYIYHNFSVHCSRRTVEEECKNMVSAVEQVLND